MTAVTETGITFSKSICSPLKPKHIYYRSYKSSNDTLFRQDLKKKDFKIFSRKNLDENYDALTGDLLRVVNKHAPSQKKVRRDNDAPFMSKVFRKAISTRSRLKSSFSKNLT